MDAQPPSGLETKRFARTCHLGALLTLLCTGFAGCFHPEPAPRMTPVYRFADAAWRSKAETNLTPFGDEPVTDVNTDAYPVLSLADEVRYTLGRKVRAPLLFVLNWRTGSGDRLPLAFPVPSTFQPGDRVALQSDVSFEGIQEFLPPSVAEVRIVDGQPSIAFDLPVPARYANSTVGLHVDGTVLPGETALYDRTAPVTVPLKAYLQFAIGIEKAAWAQGPVEFRVRSCAGSECQTLFQEVLDPSIPDERSWQTRRADLAPLAGRQVSFSFESRLLSNKRAAFSLPVWANPTVYAPVATQAPRVNIILVSLDTLSAKHLPTYGYEFPTAPFLDGVLAREGIVFERVVAAATTTPQSHMTMFTSVQPCRHGEITGVERVRPELVTLAEVLRAAGYETGAVTEDGWLGYEQGFGRGFNSYAENKSANVMTPEGQFDLTLRKARAWIVRNDDKPFFLFLHTFQVHAPYNPPEEYRNLFRERDGTEVNETSPGALRELVAYDQEIRYTDDQLRGFFEFLRERRLLDNSVIIVTADHGEEFFEHGYWGHGLTMFEEVTHVPLIIWGPGRIPQGRRSTETVGHIDLMPTILALAGVRAPAQATGRNILVPATERDPAMIDYRVTESRVDVAIGEGYEKLAVLPPSFMVQQGSRKMSRYREADGFRYEAYDLNDDPHEKKNRLPGDAAAFGPMKRLLDNYESLCAEQVRRGNGEEPARRIELDPERQKKLRALGYIE